MYDIVTFGSATRDIVIKSKNLTILKYEKVSSGQEVCFPLGSKSDVEQMYFLSGGGGTNVAATFALQGLKTAYVGAIGQDLAGQEITQELKKLGVDIRFVVKKAEKMTNHSIIMLHGEADRTILAYRGAAELLEQKDIPFRKLKAKWFYLAPMTGALCDNVEAIVQFAKENNIKVAMNPSMAQLFLPNFKDILQKIDVLFLNQEEASFLTKIPFENEKEIFKAIDAMCPGVAVMTKGEKGAIASDGKSIYSVNAHENIAVADTTGAGDSFGSGFITDFIRENGDIEKAIQFGLANSEANLTEIGAKNGLLKKGQSFESIEVTKEEIL